MTPGGRVESSTYPRPVPGSRWRTCEVSTLYLENYANALRIYVFQWLTLYFCLLWEYGIIVNPPTTCPGELLTFLWSLNSVSWKRCECTSNLRFFEWLPLYSWPLRGTVESSTSPRPVPGRRRRTCEASTLYLENCANARWFYVFEWLTLYFWPLWGYSRIVNLLTTCPVESLTYLWSFNSVSWKLCECTSNSRISSD